MPIALLLPVLPLVVLALLLGNLQSVRLSRGWARLPHRPRERAVVNGALILVIAVLWGVLEAAAHTLAPGAETWVEGMSLVNLLALGVLLTTMPTPPMPDGEDVGR